MRSVIDFIGNFYWKIGFQSRVNSVYGFDHIELFEVFVSFTVNIVSGTLSAYFTP